MHTEINRRHTTTHSRAVWTTSKISICIKIRTRSAGHEEEKALFFGWRWSNYVPIIMEMRSRNSFRKCNRYDECVWCGNGFRVFVLQLDMNGHIVVAETNTKTICIAYPIPTHARPYIVKHHSLQPSKQKHTRRNTCMSGCPQTNTNSFSFQVDTSESCRVYFLLENWSTANNTMISGCNTTKNHALMEWYFRRLQ